MATDVGVVKVLTFESAHGPRISNLALTIIAALLLVLSFPPFEYSLLAWVALAPLILALVRERRWWRALLLGEAAGSIFFYGTCWWITHSMIKFGGINPAVAYLIAVIPALVLGLFPAVFAVLLSRLVLRFGPLAMLSAPFLWVGTEFLRLMLTGMPWNFLGCSQAFTPALIQSATIGGVYGVSFLLVLVATLLAVMTVIDNPRLVLMAGMAVLTVLASNYYLGRRALALPVAAKTLKVIAVQPNFALPSEPDSLTEEAALAQLRAQTLSAMQQIQAAQTSAPASHPVQADMLIVWPESPMNFEWFTDPSVRETVVNLIAPFGAHLLLNSVVESPEEQYYNSVLDIAPSGEVVSRYDKLRLLPFGEYVPLRRVIPFIGRIQALAGDFTPGERYTLSKAGSAEIASSICFEAAFPDLAREGSRQGAAFLVNVTDDAWFGTTPEARQHLAHAVFRSVENRRAMARVANSGYSAFIEPSGRVAEQTELFKTDTPVWEMPLAPPSSQTFYTRYGDWLAWLCSVIVCAAIIAIAVDRFLERRAAYRDLSDE